MELNYQFLLHIVITFNSRINNYYSVALFVPFIEHSYFHHFARYTSFHLVYEICVQLDAVTRAPNKPNQNLDEVLCNVAQNQLPLRQDLPLMLQYSLQFLDSIEPLALSPIGRHCNFHMYT